MPELLTAAAMRAVEAAAIDSGRVTGLELMERAGCGVVAEVFAAWPELARAPCRAVVLAGPGNNGGDGFVIARLLREWGWKVEVFLFGDPDCLPPDAGENCRRWRELGPVRVGEAPPADLPADLIVDALFGTGLSRPIADPALAAWFRLMSGARAAEEEGGGGVRTVAVDIPSGLCADSGRVLGGDAGNGTGAGVGYAGAPRVMLTVSFHAAKAGHYLAEGPAHCGRLVVSDIGIGAGSGAAVRRGAWLIGAGDVGSEMAKRPDAHKYIHGHALILAGGAGRGGAARLAARGALRIGAGLVTVGCPHAALTENAARLDAVMLQEIGDAGALARILDDRRINALCLGPGLGAGRARELVPVALEHRRPTVLDADALTAWSEAPEALFAMLHETCVLTPHAGEFARLFPDLAERLVAPARWGPAFSKLDAGRAAAERAGCTVLFKGADTVIALPGAEPALCAAVYEYAAPWLATAGAGDVLAGFIAGLLARGRAPLAAARAAAWLHGAAARRYGPGLIAEDLPETLPAVLRDLVG